VGGGEKVSLHLSMIGEIGTDLEFKNTCKKKGKKKMKRAKKGLGNYTPIAFQQGHNHSGQF